MSASIGQASVFLSKAGPAARALLEPLLENVPLRANQLLVAPGQPVEYVHFLRSGLATLTCSSGGRQTAVALIGPEGFTGHSLLLGRDRNAHPTVMQIAGTGYRLRAADLHRATERDPNLRLTFLQAIQDLLEQIAETAFANAQLTVEARLARLLLMAADRLGDNDVPLTHDRIALMLGCRRAGVTMSMHLLEGEKAIRAGRGKIVIVDRARLLDAAGTSGQQGLPRLPDNIGQIGLAPEVRPS